MPDDDREELRRALDRPALERLWTAARGRFEHLGGVRGSVRLPSVSEEERRAVADLLGLRTLPRGEHLRLSLERLDRALRRSRFAVGLETVLTHLGGPLRDRPAERESRQRHRAELWREAEARVATRPELRRWLDDLRETGLLRRLASGAEPGEEARLLRQALAVLEALSAKDDEGTRLAVLASSVLGTSHGLDPGTPVATLVLRALALRQGRPFPTSAGERRLLWHGAGVVTDDVSSRVLVLGLAPVGGGRVGEALRLLAAAGEPAQWTLRQLATPGLRFPPGLVVYVCENPVVVSAAADQWGAASAPLLCGSGYPDLAGRRLLEELAAWGAELHYHGDFDWEGLRIANSLRRTIAFRPWRFTAADYRAALARGSSTGDSPTGDSPTGDSPTGDSPTGDDTPRDRPGLGGPPVEAEWDPELAPALAEAGVAVEEEEVLADLLADLERD